jgi:hypothetical protein
MEASSKNLEKPELGLPTCITKLEISLDFVDELVNSLALDSESLEKFRKLKLMLRSTRIDLKDLKKKQEIRAKRKGRRNAGININ